MKSKTILITGASTGFGHITAQRLAREGHRVFASMRDSAGRNRVQAEELRAEKIEVIELDVTKQESIDEAVRTVVAAAGRIDILINNAGLFFAGVTEAFTSDQVKALFDVNVFGLLRVTRAVLPVMRQQKDGLVINIGSIVGRVTFPFFGVYGASKFAVEALTDSLRYEVSQLGIEVALVQPSAYPTALFTKAQTPADAVLTAEYGPVGEIPSAMFKQFMTTFQEPGAPDPGEVAEAIAALIAQPKGTRASRTIVGAPFGSDTVNEQTAPVQARVVESLGLGHLAKVA